MRVTSDLFVSAILRRVFARGDFAAVERKGSEEGGAVFIRQIFRDGSETLYAPAPPSFFSGEDTGGRLFERRLEREDRQGVGEALERELRFDPDLWIVGLETDAIAGLIDIVGEEAAPAAAESLFRR